jgi:hypothetical protein
VIFGDNGCSRETARSEVTACLELAREFGITMRSFAFPRDQVGHLDVLREHGFTCYRGAEPALVREIVFAKAGKATGAPVGRADCGPTPYGIARVDCGRNLEHPGIDDYFPMHGLRRFIPLSRRVKRVVKGLDAAARQNESFISGSIRPIWR